MIRRNEYHTTKETYGECQTDVSVYHTKYLLADEWTDQNFTERADVKKMELTPQLSHTYLSTETIFTQFVCSRCENNDKRTYVT